jgi:hypothetical protein
MNNCPVAITLGVHKVKEVVVFNYAVRVLTILMGFFFLSGKLFYDHPYQLELQIIGGLLVVWGIYRIYAYRKALKELQQNDEGEEE